jgi:O-succinylbenzoate synthase
MIEQPLHHEDLVDHARLQEKMETPICLDESIRSCDDARKAIELGSCRIINIKLARVRGLAETKKIHDLCEQRGVPVWCGSMLESGVGEAHNMAMAALPNFRLPGDIAPSDRYYSEDIVDPPIRLEPDGTIKVPGGAGIGLVPHEGRMRRYTVRTFSLPA